MTRGGRTDVVEACDSVPHVEHAPQDVIEAGAGTGRVAATDPDPALDTAVYSCGCGFVFEADVSTSVGCPHCGDQQAW
jgi:hypothetical protein